MGMEELGGTPTLEIGAENAGTPTPAQQGQAPPLNNPFAEISLAELGLDEAEGSSKEGGTPPAEEGEKPVLSKQKAETGSPGDAKAAEPDEDDEDPEEPEGESGEKSEGKAEFEHPKFQKRVNRLTAEKKAAEEKAAELEARIKEIEASREQSAPVDDPTDPVWRLPEAREVNKALRETKTEVDASQGYLDRIEDGDLEGVVADLKAHKVTLPAWDQRTVQRALQRYQAAQAQELATRTAELRQIRSGHQRQLAADRGAYDTAANEHFAWLADKSDPRTEKVEKLLKANPVLGREAVGKFAAAALVKELTRYQKAKAQVTKPIGKAPGTTMPSAAQGAPPPMPSDAKEARKATADKRFQENPFDNDTMVDWVAANIPGVG